MEVLAVATLNKLQTLFSGMAKAFDFTNSQRVFNRERMDTTLKLYSEEKTDIERLADDWSIIGNDMQIAITKFGEQYDK